MKEESSGFSNPMSDKRKQILEELHGLMSKPAPNQHFYLKDGTALKSIKELADNISSMDDKEFHSHVERDDFHNWIKGVFEKEELAKKIRGVQDKEELERLLKGKKKKKPSKKPTPKPCPDMEVDIKAVVGQQEKLLEQVRKVRDSMNRLSKKVELYEVKEIDNIPEPRHYNTLREEVDWLKSNYEKLLERQDEIAGRLDVVETKMAAKKNVEESVSEKDALPDYDRIVSTGRAPWEKVRDVYVAIEKAKDNVRRKNFAEAKRMYSKIAKAFDKINLPEEDKGELFEAIKKLYSHIVDSIAEEEQYLEEKTLSS